jgi:hypothetical protein
MVNVILGSFSNVRPFPLPELPEFPELPELLPPEELLPLVQLLPEPFFTMMVLGVESRTYPSGTRVSDTTTVLPGMRPVTTTVPSFPVT